jgi:signal transduction histidine kinase
MAKSYQQPLATSPWQFHTSIRSRKIVSFVPMLPPTETLDLLAFRSMPQLAEALRRRIDRVIHRWTESVERHLPDADPLTSKQVRDSIPTVLEKIAAALESGRPEDTFVLSEVGVAHGVARFQENYNIEEVLIEYRILRRVIFDELHDAAGAQLSFNDAIPVDMGIDIALQQGVTSFVHHLTDQLKSAAAAESKYLSYLSHDLRNNLNSATLMLEMLAENFDALPQFSQEAQDIRSLRHSIFETVAGMDRLLQAERLRKHQVTLKLGPVNLHRLVRDLFPHIVPKAMAKGLRVENAVPPGAAAHSDRELVVLVLQNLLGNAVKFSNRGTVRVEAVEDELGWKILVKDEGPGIAPDKLAAIFEEFTRGETHGQPGLGLGLTIASHAARILGSQLTVESKLGQGSTFSFSLPPAKPEQAQ